MTAIGFVERPVCPGCGARDLRSLLVIPFGDRLFSHFVHTYYGLDPDILAKPYALSQCHDCGLIFQRFVGNDALLSELYARWAPTTDTAVENASFAKSIAAPAASRDGHEIMAAAAFLKKPISDLRVLDFGMGWGLWPAIANKLGADAYGTELSPKMRAEAARNGVKVLDEIEGKFDFINLEQVIEHVPAPADLLCQLSRHLRPGGLIKLSLPNASNAKAVISAIKSGRYRGDYETIIPIQPLEHINSFTPRALRVMAGRVGLAPVKPTLAQRYSFVGQSKLSVKELVRPFWQYHNRRNIYAWFRRV